MLFLKLVYRLLLLVSLLFLFLPTAIEASGSSAIGGKLIPSYYILLLDKTPNSNLKKSGQSKKTVKELP